MANKPKKKKSAAATKKIELLSADAVEKMIIKEFGKGAIRKASDPSLEITRIPCSILSVDDALGGGYPRGRSVEIYGLFAVGKTALVYYLIAKAQAEGLSCKMYDAEHGFDPVFAASLGVDIDELGLPEFVDANQMVSQMEVDLMSRQVDVILLDSIASLLPKAEREISMEDGNMGTHQARLMSAALRRLTNANRNTCIIFINQLRESIGVMFGKSLLPTGGRAMGFYAGVRIELSKTETIYRNTTVIDHKTGKEKPGKIAKGHRVLLRIEKDKTGGAKQSDSTTFVYDYDLGGIDPIEDLLYLGRKYGFISIKGETWILDDYEEEKQVGRKRFKKWLRKNKAVAEELQEKLEPFVYREESLETDEDADDEDDDDEDEDDE